MRGRGVDVNASMLLSDDTQNVSYVVMELQLLLGSLQIKA